LLLDIHVLNQVISAWSVKGGDKRVAHRAEERDFVCKGRVYVARSIKATHKGKPHKVKVKFT